MTAERARALLEYVPETGVIRWRVDRRGHVKAGDQAGSIGLNGYMRVGVDGSEYLCHRLAWLIVHGEWPTHQLDHINGSRTDNRLCNLRMATNAENHQNLGLRSTNTSGHTGVTWNEERGKWVAQLFVSGKHKTLGYFTNKEAAAIAYREAKAQHHSFEPTLRGEAA